MRTSFILILIIAYYNSFTQDSCVVKIFPGDCQSCYLGLKVVDEYDTSVKKTLVFPKLSDNEINTYLKTVLCINDLSSYNIFVSDSIYNSIDNTLTSEIYVYNHNKLSDHSLLRSFYGLNEPQQEIKIPDTISFSPSVTLLHSNEHFFITDSKFGKCVLISKDNGNKIDVVEMPELTTEENFFKISGDSVCYKMFTKYQEVLQDVNMDKMKVNHTFNTKGDMYSVLMAPRITGEGQNLGLMYETGIIRFASANDYEIIRFCKKSVPEDYIIYPGLFSKEGNKYLVQMLSKNKTNDDQYMVGYFHKEGNQLIFNRFIDFKLPHEYLPAEKFKSLRKILNHSSPYIFIQYSLSYYDISDNTSKLLPFDSVSMSFEMPDKLLKRMKFDWEFKFIDAFVTKDYFKMLYKKGDYYYVAKINRKDGSLIDNKQIEKSSKELKSGYSFYTEDMLCYLSSDNYIVLQPIKYINQY